MNRPNRYISREAVNSVQLSFENLEEYYREKDWMQERIDRFWNDAKMIGKMNPYGALHYVRHVVGYEAYLLEYAAQRGIPASELTDVLEELMEAAKNYDSFDAWFSHIADISAGMAAADAEKTGRPGGGGLYDHACLQGTGISHCLHRGCQ